MVLLYTATLFVSATLLFFVQPMIAKMILPRLGGTPAVWNTCMVFFQAVLLAGYAYAHAGPKWFGSRRHILLHLPLLLLPLLVLPIGIAGQTTPPETGNPIPWLLGVLALSIGLPFFVVATSAPLLQKWFAQTGHVRAADPYFLYAASNVGSMLALLSYPTLVEPYLTLQQQVWVWSAGYLLLVGLTAVCGFYVWRGRSVEAESPTITETTAEPADTKMGRRMVYWIVLAFVPSSLMLGVTTYLTTDIAAIPLLWVVPLAIYLLSFIFVFARKQLLPHALMCRVMPPVVLCLVFLMVSGGTHQLRTTIVMPAHLAALFVVAMVCHGELARRRPAARHLTAFFLCMSVGGVLGGMFNALLAPLVFTRVIEYPLVLVASCLLLPRHQEQSVVEASRRRPWLEVAWPAAVAAVTVLLLWVLTPDTAEAGQDDTWLHALPSSVSALLIYVLPVLLCFAIANRPVRFALSVGALFLAGGVVHEMRTEVLCRERSFFGDMHVRHDPTGKYIQLFHGTTLHGMQHRDAKLRQEPLSYFHRTGPVGQLFGALQGPKAPRNVAVTGLGVGTLVSYAQSGQRWTFYEIDPAVSRVGNDPKYFTFLQDARRRGVEVNVQLGDARLKLNGAKNAEYDLFIHDVFSSDAVPVHLLTREALQLYLSKLAPDGLLFFNISNRHLDLEPLLGALAKDADLHALVQHDLEQRDDDAKSPSSWVVMARRPELLDALTADGRWRAPRARTGVPLWTDDFSNLLSTFKR